VLQPLPPASLHRYNLGRRPSVEALDAAEKRSLLATVEEVEGEDEASAATATPASSPAQSPDASYYAASAAVDCDLKR
jgi:hypothetical protein